LGLIADIAANTGIRNPAMHYLTQDLEFSSCFPVTIGQISPNRGKDRRPVVHKPKDLQTTTPENQPTGLFITSDLAIGAKDSL
jgi:hypothetical protein